MYANIRNFGSPTNSEPLTVCLADTMDKSFQNGSIGHLFGPRSKRCQAYMTEKCADKWDGYCEYFVQQNGPNAPWPQNIPWPNIQQRPWETQLGLPTLLTSGEQMLKGAAERRFCTYPTCQPTCEPFDPTNPNSQRVKYYPNECIPVCRVDPNTIDQDPLMDRMIANPTVTGGTLINICNTAKRDGTDLSGTKIGAFCEFLSS